MCSQQNPTNCVLVTGDLLNLVIPRPSPTGEEVPGLGKVSRGLDERNVYCLVYRTSNNDSALCIRLLLSIQTQRALAKRRLPLMEENLQATRFWLSIIQKTSLRGGKWMADVDQGAVMCHDSQTSFEESSMACLF